MKTVGVVLAGGLSRRYGSPKAFAIHNGRAFYELAYEALESVCDQVVVVARPEFQRHFKENLTILVDVDEFKGCGPLVGIYTVMSTIQAERYVVLPCDMPYINKDVMESLVSYEHDEDVLSVKVEEKQHPLVGIYKANMKCIIYHDLKNGQFSVLKLLRKVKVRWVNGNQLTKDACAVFRNINFSENKE